MARAHSINVATAKLSAKSRKRAVWRATCERAPMSLAPLIARGVLIGVPAASAISAALRRVTTDDAALADVVARATPTKT